jgi:aminoglycoside 3-N-acetyltransferase
MNLRSIAKRALPYLPSWLQRRLRSTQEKQRLTEHAARKQRTRVAVDDILKHLESLEITRDVIVHGSISNIGKLDKPVTALVDQWLSKIDLTRQTILVPALPYNTKTMLEHLNECASFDVRTARNAMGVISTTIMDKPGTLRSVHPTHSVVALGADAKAYVDTHHQGPTPFGQYSPYWRITEKRGQILMIGVGLNSVTCFHVYEDMLGDDLPFAVYLPENFDVPCINAEDEALTVSTRCHNQKLSVVRDCERARPWLEAAGAIRSLKLGESELSVVDAYLFTKTLLERLLNGESIYGKVRLTPTQHKAVNTALQRLDRVP